MMPNNDYVKREDIYLAVTKISKEIVFGNQDDDKVVDIVNSIPAADVEPKRKTGRWIDLDDHLLCSSCGAAHTGTDKNYCPNCGAKMQREEDDV